MHPEMLAAVEEEAALILNEMKAAGVQLGRKKLQPDHAWGCKSLPPMGISKLNPLLKVQPAGTTLAAKLRVPMRDRSSCFVHWV